MFQTFFGAVKGLTLPAFLVIGILMIIGCYLLFPGRIGQLLSFITRMYFAALFVFSVYEVADLRKEDKAIVLGLALVGAGMAS